MEKPKINTFLKSLGSDADSIAKSLTELGVRGKKAQSKYCPIANACNKYANCPREISISSSAYISYVTDDREDDIFPAQDPELDNDVQVAISSFINKFDAGIYPQLITTE